MRGRDGAWLLLIAAVGAVATAIYVAYGPPDGHSGNLNLAWHEEFAEQFAAGELYPRWIRDMMGGVGSPVFIFYAPIPFWISGVTDLALNPPLNSYQTFGLASGLMIILSGFAFFAFARSHVAAGAAAAGAIFYMFAPYHFEIDLAARQAIGEIANYMFAPLVFLGIRRMGMRAWAVPTLAIGVGGLALSHLPTLLLVGLFAAPYTLVMAARGRPVMVLVGAGFGALLGIALAAAYVGPAMTLQDAISTFRYWPKFMIGDWFWLDGKPEPNPDFAFRLVRVQALTTLVGGLLLVVALWRMGAPAFRALWPWAFAILICWFMMSPLSEPIWRASVTLQKVQFPWRIGIMLDLATSLILAWAVAGLGRRGGGWTSLAWAPAIAAGLVIAYLGATGVKGMLPLMRTFQTDHNRNWVDTTVRERHDALAYAPPTVALPDTVGHADHDTLISSYGEMMNVWLSLPRVAAAEGVEVAATRWEPRAIDIRVKAEAPAELEVRQLWFPWWRASVGEAGAALDLTPAPTTGVIRIAAPAGDNVIALRMPPLETEIAGRRIEIERWSAWASLAAAAFILLLFMVAALKPRGEN